MFAVLRNRNRKASYTTKVPKDPIPNACKHKKREPNTRRVLPFCWSAFSAGSTFTILFSCGVLFAIYYSLNYWPGWNKSGDSPRSLVVKFQETTTYVHHVEETNNIRSEDLAVFWINLDSSTERRRAFEERLESLDVGLAHVERVRAIHEKEVLGMLGNHRLVLNNGIELDYQWKSEPTWKMHSADVYLYKEAATVLSHLRAIHVAYQKGFDYALILEDDVVLQPHFQEEWKSQVKHAPKDWGCLQWITNNEVVRERGMKMLPDDTWISWQPEHWSSAAYMLNRRGMHSILSHTVSSSPDGSLVWQLEEPGVLVSDELIFLLARTSYTSTYSKFELSPVESTMGRINAKSNTVYKGTGLAPPDSPNIKKVKRQSWESILVLLTFRTNSSTAVAEEIERLVMDVIAMAHHHVRCVWRVMAVVTDEKLVPVLQSEIQRLPDFVQVVVEVKTERFNKFSFYAKSIPDMKAFDRILLKDSDMRIAGFPWTTFLKTVEGAIVASPLYQGIDDTLARNDSRRRYKYGKRGWYQLHNGGNWMRHWGSLSIFRNLTPVQVPFLEQSFALLEGGFASWFLKQVLTDSFIEQPSDWGPDKMWCAAAFEYDPNRPPCVLAPLIVKHEDTRQIVQDRAYSVHGHIALHNFRQDKRMRSWMEKVDAWDYLIGGKGLQEIESACKLVTGSSTFDLQDCALLVPQSLQRT